jgi:DNA-binding transcriptional LysR family regulator
MPVRSIEAAIDAVRSGLCFGWLPMYRIRPELESGELILLNLPVGDTREVRLQLVRRDLSSSSVEVSALSEMLGVDRGAEVI